MVKIIPIAAFITVVILSFRYVVMLEDSVFNLLMLDQWYFLNPVLQKESWIDIFRWQHGPHRQGLGGLIQAIIYPASDWNVLWESVVSVGFLAITGVLALLLKKRISGRWHYADIGIPFLFLSFRYYENVLINLSHGVIPVLTVILSGYVLTLRPSRYQSALLALLVLVGVYSGFAFFNSILVLGIFFVLAFQRWNTDLKANNLIFLLAAILGFASFFYDYTFIPAVDCFDLQFLPVDRYISFIGLLVQRGLGLQFIKNVANPNLHFLADVFSYLFLVSQIMLSLWMAYLFIFQKKKHSAALFLLSTFTLLFWVFTAIGRICLGEFAATAPRYIIYSVPGMLAIYIAISSEMVKIRFRQELISLFTIAILFGEWKSDKLVRENLNEYKNAKIVWRTCYMEKKEIQRCNEEAKVVIVHDEPFIRKMLQKMEQQKIHFFKTE